MVQIHVNDADWSLRVHLPKSWVEHKRVEDLLDLVSKHIKQSPLSLRECENDKFLIDVIRPEKVLTLLLPRVALPLESIQLILTFVGTSGRRVCTKLRDASKVKRVRCGMGEDVEEVSRRFPACETVISRSGDGLFNAISTFTNLVALDVSGLDAVDDPFMRKLQKSCKMLTALDVSDCSNIQLEDRLFHFRNLTAVDISNTCLLPPARIKYLAARHENAPARLENVVLLALEMPRPFSQTLRWLSLLFACGRISAIRNLPLVGLHMCRIQDENAQSIFAEQDSPLSKSLVDLCLQNCGGFTDESLDVLARGGTGQLRVLDLDMIWRITHEGVSEVVRANPFLKYVYLKGTGHVNRSKLQAVVQHENNKRPPRFYVKVYGDRRASPLKRSWPRRVLGDLFFS